MSSGAKKEVLDRLYTCGAGRIRNPRTDRCVKASGPLGRALNAAAVSLRAGESLKRCNKGAYDPGAQECTTDKHRVSALRELTARYQLARGSNGNSRAMSKLITSQAISKALAANARSERNEVASMFERLAAYSTDLEAGRVRNVQALRAGLEEVQVRAMDLQRRLAAAERERNQYRRDLNAARAQLLQVTKMV